MHIVGMVIAPDGTIDNASSATIDEAVSNGFVSGSAVVGVLDTAAPDATFQLYPNPATTHANIAVNLDKPTVLSVEVFSADGRLVASKSYGTLTGSFNLPVLTQDLSAGVYKVRILADGKQTVKTLVVE